MFKLNNSLKTEIENWDFEFWPKEAKILIEKKDFAGVIELCEKNIGNGVSVLAARLIYAAALKEMNRLDEATEQIYQILSIDPDHLAALRLLGDIHFQKEDAVAAMANYNRVLEIDQACTGLRCEFVPRPDESLPQITIVKGPEFVQDTEIAPPSESLAIETVEITEIPLPRNPFTTETVADLYLRQGQPRRAIEIFRELIIVSNNERLAEKLAAAEKAASQKEHRDVEYSN